MEHPSNKLTIQEASGIFMKNYGYVRSVAFSASPVVSLVEDIAHDAYLCFMENVDYWDYSEEKIRPLLKSITRNMAARAWKNHHRNHSDTLRKIAEFIRQETVDDPLFNSACDQLEEKLLALKLCLSKLSPEKRELIEKIYMDSRSYEEIAELDGKSIDVLYTQTSRIRNILRDCVTRTLAMEADHE